MNKIYLCVFNGEVGNLVYGALKNEKSVADGDAAASVDVAGLDLILGKGDLSDGCLKGEKSVVNGYVAVSVNIAVYNGRGGLEFKTVVFGIGLGIAAFNTDDDDTVDVLLPFLPAKTPSAILVT